VRAFIVTAAASLLVAMPGAASRPSFTFTAKAPAKVRLGATAIVLSVRGSERAAVTATLYRGGTKLHDWALTLTPRRTRLALTLPRAGRSAARYTLFLRATAGSSTVFHTLRYRIEARRPRR
jgi:hypothetical protein